MKRKIIVFAMLLATTVFWLPSESSVSAQSRQNKSGKIIGTTDPYQPARRRVRSNRGRKYTHGYRNYGQYRRTQVGNRRYRVAKRYYWQDGVRLSRYVRVYY